MHLAIGPGVRDCSHCHGDAVRVRVRFRCKGTISVRDRVAVRVIVRVRVGDRARVRVIVSLSF